MKLKLAIILSGLLFLASPCWSFTIVSGDSNNGIDVGAADIWETSSIVENSVEKETEWIQKYFNDATITVTKYDPPTIYNTNSYGVLALELTFQPDYFFVKIGNGQTTNTHHLFRNNNESFDWGVFGITDLMGYTGNDFSFSLISHGGGADNAAPVPEPATMLLLGTGILGVASLRKKIHK